MTGQHRPKGRSRPAWLTRAADAPASTVQHRLVGGLDLRAAATSEGTFEGYACVWDVVDSYGTTFAPRSFGAGGLDTDPYPLLWMHDRDVVLGTFTATEDDRGLLIRGSWDDTGVGRDARARAKSGSAPGLSVGFVPILVDPDDEDRFTQVRLVETSQIVARMASVPGASIHNARQADREVPADDAGAAAVAAALLSLATTRARKG